MQLTDAQHAKRSRLLSHRLGTKPGPKIGRPRNQTIAEIMRKKGCSRSEAYRVLDERNARRRTKRDRLLAETMRFSSVIKPSDCWNFDTVHYPRIDDDPMSFGYIPGDLYANCLFYFARPGDLVVAPMAGSGQVHHVYLDRAVWTKGLAQPWDIDLRMFDLTPRGRYAALIGHWDILHGFPPVGRPADYVVMDVPYLGMCRRQYSDRPDDIANMDAAGWTTAMHAIADACASASTRRCTIIVPVFADPDRAHVVLCPEIVRDAWRGAGYRLYRPCYASQRIQSSRRPRMPMLNNAAKAMRVPLADISEVLTFDLP